MLMCRLLMCFRAERLGVGGQRVERSSLRWQRVGGDFLWCLAGFLCALLGVRVSCCVLVVPWFLLRSCSSSYEMRYTVGV